MATRNRGAKKRGQAPAEIVLTASEKELVAISLATLPGELRTPSVVKMLVNAIRVPAFAKRLQADPRRCLEESGQDLPNDMAIQVHINSKDMVHLFLPTEAALPIKHDDKIHLSDSDLMSGTAFARLASDKKRDGIDGKKRSDSDDKGDKGSWTTDDSGDGATDIGDRRRKNNKD